jgi:hypothetical protein
MQLIDEIKAMFSKTPFRLLPREILVLKGIISGDGDIGGRMASSSSAAKPPVDTDRMKFLESVADLHRELGTPISEIDSIHQYETNSD